MQPEWKKVGVLSKFKQVTLQERDVQEGLGVEDNIRMILEEIGINTRKWVDSAQDRDYWRAPVNVALNFQVL